jgi:hypothetical protein
MSIPSNSMTGTRMVTNPPSCFERFIPDQKVDVLRGARPAAVRVRAERTDERMADAGQAFPLMPTSSSSTMNPTDSKGSPVT